MKMSLLSDGSTIERFTRIEMSDNKVYNVTGMGIFGPNPYMGEKESTVAFAEAVTSKGETVIVSS